MKNPTHRRRMTSIMLVFGILAIGAIFAMVDIPLAVSQPLTIPIASITGDIAMDAAKEWRVIGQLRLRNEWRQMPHGVTHIPGKGMKIFPII